MINAALKPETLPDDPAALKEMVAALASEIHGLTGNLQSLTGELKNRDILIEKLKMQLAGMRRHRFGSSSEALGQLEMRLESEEIA